MGTMGESGSLYASGGNNGVGKTWATTTGTLTEILNRPNGEARKLPVPTAAPKIAVQELLNPTA